MSQKKSSTGSILGKIAIGVAGVIGGLLIGSAIQKSQNQKKQKQRAASQIQKSNVQYQKNIQDYDNIDELMTCPISSCIMTQPYIISQCGHTFQKRQIENWVKKKACCPLCKIATRQESLRPNYQLKQVIAHYQITKKGDQSKMKKVQEK